MPSTGQTAEIEEERRLLYVAMTRAKQHLTLIAPQRYYVRQQRRHGDAHVYATLTRFIPGKLTRLFEQTGASPKPPQIDVIPTTPSIDVGARVRALWD